MNLDEEIQHLPHLAQKNKKVYRQLFHDLKKLKPFDADELIQTQHELVFSEINCLDCANCCKTTPALLTDEDVNRISRHLKISVRDFLFNYTARDDDGDLVYKQTPCVFLDGNNYCKIYDARPKACREYPHTQQKNQQSILALSAKNTEICPAVKRIFDNLLP